MRKLLLGATLVVSLAAGYLLGGVLPWWATAILVIGCLGYVRLRLGRGT